MNAAPKAALGLIVLAIAASVLWSPGDDSGPQLGSATAVFQPAGSGRLEDGSRALARFDDLERGARVTFGEGGALEFRRHGQPQARIGLGLRSVGRGSDRRPVSAPEGVELDEAAALLYRRDRLDEWYMVFDQGLEQGFTLHSPPVGPREERVVLELGIEGAAAVELEGGTVAIRDDCGGESLLRYGDLVAWDGTGRVLPAALACAEDGISIHVDDRDAVYPVTIDPLIIVETGRLEPSIPGTGFYGRVSDIDGDRAVVAADNAAFLYERVAGTWVEEAVLIGPGGFGGFGVHVAIDGERVAVGEPGPVGTTGRVHLYVRTGMDWVLETVLTPNDTSITRGFGAQVDLDGEILAVGATASPGKVFVFHDGPSGWEQVTKLIPSDFVAGDRIGRAVAVSGERILVGSEFHNGIGNNSGAAYVFRRTAGTWVEEQQLIASDELAREYFGAGVSLEGEMAVIGAPGKSTGSIGEHGGAYAFVHDGGAWVEKQELIFSNLAAWDYFGEEVATDGERALMGAWRALDGGAALLYSPCGDQLVEELVLPAGIVSGHFYGRGPSLSAQDIFVGATGFPSANGSLGALFTFEAQEAFERTCVAAPNSVGAGARLSLEGCHVVAINTLEVSVTQAPPGQSLLFLLGPAPAQQPFGDGFLCIDGSIVRLGSPLVSDASGHASSTVDLGAPPANVVQPGSVWYFQCWYRDPGAGGTGFNLSDAVRACFE